MGDLNAKVGEYNRNVEQVMGKWSIGARNENGDKLIEACSFVGLIIGGSLFPHKHCHQATWIATDNTTETQIDHFCIFKTGRSCFLDVRVKRSADIGSDHHLLAATMRLFLSLKKRLVRSLMFQNCKPITSKMALSPNLVRNCHQIKASMEQKWSSLKNVYLLPVRMS